MVHTCACALRIAHVIGMVGMVHLSTLDPCSSAGARFGIAHVIGMVGMVRLSTLDPCSSAGARFAAACSFSGSGGVGDSRPQLDKA